MKTTQKVRDPVCGMTVAPERAAARVTHAGQEYFFCSKGCGAKFQSDPARYLAEPGSSPMASDAKQAGLIQWGTRAQQAGSASAAYVCPMDPEVRTDKPGACPQCGMALEPETVAVSATRVEFTCPMHPEIVRPGPGNCPICGMALEPRTVTLAEEENPELRGMTRRLWISTALTVPLLAIAMGSMLSPHSFMSGVWRKGLPWLELLLATPVVLWGGWPFFQRGWASVVNRSTNMFTLIAMGTGVAYLYSMVAILYPGIFPASFRSMGDRPDVYFEAAAAIVTLVLLGQVLELRARSRTSSAIRALLDLSPKMARVIVEEGSERDVPL